MLFFSFKIYIDDYISVLASLGAFASAIAALFTIKQVKKQREASYQPDIFLGFNSTIVSRITNLQTGHRDIQCIVFDSDLKESETWGIWHTIENIGLGTAKNVNIVWDFNFKKAYKIIASIVKEPTKVDFGDKHITLLDKENDELIDSGLNLEDLTTHYDFVLPRKDEKFNLSPSIPQAILEAYTIMFLARYNIFNRKEMDGLYFENFDDFPDLTCQLSYTDIGGKTYRKKLGFDIDMRLTDHMPDILNLKKIKQLDIQILVDPKVIRA